VIRKETSKNELPTRNEMSQELGSDDKLLLICKTSLKMPLNQHPSILNPFRMKSEKVLCDVQNMINKGFKHDENW
jgi:hypothetical protein